ncbi:glycosyltransferase family 4 protein [Salinivibrio sp. DV]|uniref:glycosyltransferase family 4 protein n=1 Tax=Salinivibrio sp. SS2 TaxID=1892894 RepID=UPI00084BDE61|nr:glycosyltransferase family 4 protein [Salinivibrio sp. DV]ODP99266.1 glycosyl hydrolase family 1 [Salinivibrio sp. DV]
MRITFITNLYPCKRKPFKGTFVRNVFEGFRKNGCDVKLIALRDGGSWHVYKLLRYILFFWRSFWFAMKASKSDILYIHYTSHSSIGVIVASWLRGRRYLNIVSNVHGSDILPEKKNIFSWLKINFSKKIINLSNVVVSPSNYFKDILVSQYKVPRDKIVVSPSGGVDSGVFQPQADSVKSYTFGYVGRIEKNKGIDELIEAFKLVKGINSNYSLLIVGSGSHVPELREKINSIAGITFIEGMSQRELVEIYNTIRFLVFPSKLRESLGLIPIEAMMCGTPVLSSCIGATHDYIVSNMREYSFKPGSVDELKASLLQAAAISKNEYDSLCQLALKVAGNYDSERVIRELYRQLKDRLGSGNNA